MTLSPQERRDVRRRWRDATRTVYEPASLERLRDAIDYLHLVAYPGMGSPGRAPIRRTSGEWSPEETPDKVRDKYRRQLRRIESRIDDLAKEALEIAEGTPPDLNRPRGWYCPECRRGQRFGATFCDHCGRPRPQEEAIA